MRKRIKRHVSKIDIRWSMTEQSQRITVNRHGGDVTVVRLPEVGLKGNIHFPFSDLNNIVAADLMLKWLKEKKLDR